MVKGIALEDFLKAGGKARGLPRRSLTPIVDQLALKLLGVLADAPDIAIRQKALKKAALMLSRGGRKKK